MKNGEKTHLPATDFPFTLNQFNAPTMCISLRNVVLLLKPISSRLLLNFHCFAKYPKFQ